MPGACCGGTAATNVVPDFAQSEIDLRVTRLADREPLFTRLEALAREISTAYEVKIEITGGLNRPPKENHPTEAALFPEFQRAAKEVGLKPFTWVHGGGASDGNFLGAAFIVLMPIALDRIALATNLSAFADQGALANIQHIIFGVIIIVLLIKEPDGLASLLRRLVPPGANPRRAGG